MEKVNVQDDCNELALVPKLYQTNLYNRLKNKNFGLAPPEDIFSGPEVVEFDPTTACNLGCPECISGSLLGAGGFSRQSIESILNSFVELDVKAVVLIGGGEPMMHPMIGEIIDFLYDKDIHIGITTNGLFIEKYIEKIATKVTWLRVSVDSATSSTYQEVRPDKFGNSLFGELIRQMKILGNFKNRKCTFGYSMLLLTRMSSEDNKVKFTNANEIYEAASLAKEIGCDYFEVKPSFDDNHFHIMQPKSIMNLAKKQLIQAKDSLTDENFKILTATNLFDILECKPTQQPKDYTSCPITNLRTLVSPSGVFPCPYFRGDTSRSYGNPNHHSLSSIWRSEQKRQVQKDLNPRVDCKFHCIRHNTNLELQKFGQSDPNYQPNLKKDYNRFF